jgi:hypothetical protein
MSYKIIGKGLLGNLTVLGYYVVILRPGSVERRLPCPMTF